MFTAKLKGTTFTGHPTSTTFGNTWRMFFYAMFIADQLGIRMHTVNAGDDVVAVME